MQQDDKRRSYHVAGDGDKLRFLRRLMDDNVTLERAWHEINRRHFEGRAAASTVEALMYQLREGGIAVLKEAPALRRLAALSESQLHEVCERLQKLNPEIAKPWAADEVVRLVEAWTACHDR